MGQRGPKGKSNAQKGLSGNAGKRGATPASPALSGPPGAPPWLSPAARVEWDRVLPELAGRLSKGDMAALAAYCEAVADLQDAIATLAAEGTTFVTEKGYVGQHPAVAMKAAATRRIKEFAREFGLTPASRDRVPMPAQPPEADPLGEFLERGPNG